MVNKFTNPDEVDWRGRLARLRSAKFEELYPAQEAALESYARHKRGLESVAIELPTGAGKSLIALMILDYWMSQEKRCAVLCGTKNLARQFKEEADALGVQAVLFEGGKNTWAVGDKFKYKRAQAIAVLNYWGYINQSPGLDPADIVIFDDAHLAENAAHGLYSMEISKYKHLALYDGIVAALADRFPHYSTVVDLKQGGQTPFAPVELISFTDWCDFTPTLEALAAASPDCQHGGTLSFEWARVKRNLRAALCFVSAHGISIRPGSYPTTNEAHIKKPIQRIFLSATIGTADDLARRIGIPRIQTLPLEAKYRSAVPGKRLLLFPESEGREEDMVAMALSSAVRLKRSVWLCVSAAEANSWAERLRSELSSRGIGDQPIFIAEGEAEEIDQFIEARTGHLFTAGRYDGMDFEGETCRLVVIPSLPQACGPYERFISENLADASFMYSRVLQRIKQALGRATRNDHDWAIYIFLKNSLTHYLTSDEAFDHLPSNVQDEIGFGVDVSSKSNEDIGRVFSAFARGKLAEIQFPQRPIQFPEGDNAGQSEVADNEVEFWVNMYARLSFDRASADAKMVAEKLEGSGQPGYSLYWRYLRAQAAYLRFKVDTDAAGLTLARSEIGTILEAPRQSAWFSRLNRLRQSLNLEVVHDAPETDEYDAIIRSWNQLLGSELRNPKSHAAWLDQLRTGLAGNDHGAFCVALRKLLKLLGWEAEIRDKVEGDTDVLATIALSSKRYLLVIEGKPEMAADKPLPLRYVAQVLAQLERYRNDVEFRSHEMRAIVVSKTAHIEDSAVEAAKGVTLIRQEGLVAIVGRCVAAFQRYASVREKTGSLPRRSDCVESLEMSARPLALFELCATRGRVLSPGEAAKPFARHGA